MVYSLCIGMHHSDFEITGQPTEGQLQPPLVTRPSLKQKMNCENELQTLFTSTSDGIAATLCPLSSSDATLFHSEASTNQHPASSVAGPSVYYIGLIDILQTWTTSKKIERIYKTRILGRDPRGISAMPPKKYAQRFQKSMKRLFDSCATE